jgi:hypothetical protein
VESISVESKDTINTEADYAAWHANKDPEFFWQALEKTHKVDSISTVKEMAEFVARQHYYSITGSYEMLMPFSEHFRATYKAFTDNGQGTIKEKTTVMGLFSCAGYDKICGAQEAIVK